ncbi:MAG: flagellar biosynthetic protein FliO [Syntrophobacterales bacterium]|nr:flagellar biosynthetic protein FliO [Syntrophobacterales bacterium]
MEQPSLGYLILKTTGILIVLIGLMVGVVFFLRKYLPGIVRAHGGGNRIKVIERRILSPKHSIVLVEVDGIRFIVGLSPQNIVFLERASLDSNIFQDEEDTEVRS